MSCWIHCVQTCYTSSILDGDCLKCAAWPPKSVWANSEQIVANIIIIVVTYSQHFWSFALAPFALALPLSMIWESVFTQVKGNNSAFNFPGFALGLRYRLVLCLERYSPQVWDVTTWGSPDPRCMPRSCFEGLDSTSPWTSQCQLMMSFKPSGLRWLRWLDDLMTWCWEGRKHPERFLQEFESVIGALPTCGHTTWSGFRSQNGKSPRILQQLATKCLMTILRPNCVALESCSRHRLQGLHDQMLKHDPYGAGRRWHAMTSLFPRSGDSSSICRFVCLSFSLCISRCIVCKGRYYVDRDEEVGR